MFIVDLPEIPYRLFMFFITRTLLSWYSNRRASCDISSGVEEKEVYHPPRTHRVPTCSRTGYHRYYERVYNYVHQPGYSTTTTKVRL